MKAGMHRSTWTELMPHSASSGFSIARIAFPASGPVKAAT